MRRSIGFDYSSLNVYWAIANEDKTVEEIGVLAMVKEEHWMHLFAWDLQNKLCQAANLGIEKAWIEKPWAREGAFAWTAIQTSAMAHRIEMAALLSAGSRKIYPCMVDPGVWRKAVLGNGRPKDKKQAAVDWAKETYGYEPPSLKVRSYDPDHNYCEALAIAHYGLLQ